MYKEIELVQKEYSKSTNPWVVGFSGGKDSSAVVKVLFNALSKIENPSNPIYITYCDTGVDIPVISNLVKETLLNIDKEARLLKLPIITTIEEPELKNKYFVKVIGRGYPPPTNKFRWCTDKLRVEPVKKLVNSVSATKECTVLLGTRYGESIERDKILKKNRTNNKYYFKQIGNSKVKLFMPIINFSLEDVWSCIYSLKLPTAINFNNLSTIYKQGGGDCPIINDDSKLPCSNGRFGCWTCTVVRKDKSTSNLILHGHSNLKPLLDFRNWLANIRDDPKHRCSVRRNGQKGPGPFRLRSRKLILNNLLHTEKISKYDLISREEIVEIKRLWKLDNNSEKYKQDFIST